LETGFFNQTVPTLEKMYEKIGGIKISQKRLTPQIITQADGKKMKLFMCRRKFLSEACANENPLDFFGKNFVFNQTNIKYDIFKLRNHSYINDFTKNVKVESIFFSPHLQTHIIIKIEFVFFPSKILQKNVIYVSTFCIINQGE
jgi:uncharacterized protein YtpQ (UPF0354 family)